MTFLSFDRTQSFGHPQVKGASLFTSVLVFTCAFAVVGCKGSSGGGSTTPKSDEHALVGAPAPDFDLARVGSAEGAPRVRLSDLRGKVVVVDFWATWCKPCKESFPAYQKLSGEKPDVAFVGVSIDEDPNGIPQFVEETGATFPVVWDEGQVTSQAYAPPTMPTSFVVDKNGIVRFVHAGFHAGDEAELAQVIDGLR